MIRAILALLFAASVAIGCRSNPAAFEASKVNQAAIGNVKLGQTMDQVKSIMGTPESSDQRLLENGVPENTWYYLTDYRAETNTAITFLNGKAVSIVPTRWLGNGTFSKKK